MGPLEIGRGIDSGVVLNQDMPSHPSVNNVRRILTSDSMSDPFLRDPSTSTLVSGFSTLSSNTTLTGQGRPDTDHGTESSSWSGDHPLLFDYTAEPDSIDDDSYPSHRISSSHPHGYLAVSRHKGHTLSLGTTQEPTQLQDSEISFFASGSKTRRRRNGPKGAEERSWTSHTDKDKDQKQNGGLEPGGKRVIIHQVTTTDTLAGIALNYGIQVSILKKCNKLWTNDSIHTRKYLYIPFEECSVARQPGVVMDETTHSIMLPQRVQPIHERIGSSLPGTPFHGAQSSLTGSPLSEHGSSPGDHSTQASQAHLSSDAAALSGSMPDYGISPPPISAVTAGMLPSSSGLSRSIPVSSVSPRLGTWNEPKSMVAPPISSPTMTTTMPKSNNSLLARSLSPRRSTIASSSLSCTSRGSDAILFSEDLPNTVVVSPSMTHEALAARFKEMEFVSSEQHQRKTLSAEQELRTNPVHHRHKTTDLRQYAHLQQHQQKQQQQQLLDSGRNSIASSAAGSRRTSADLGTGEDAMSSAGGLLSRRGSGFGQYEQGSPGSLGDNPAIEEVSEDLEGDNHHQQSSKDEEFVTFGHQQHIYESDDMRPRGQRQNGHGSQLSERYEAGDPEWTQRRQEVVTVPAGLLSFFPSPEHSKKLETPQSISKLQNRMDSYHTGSLSSSSTGSGSPRGTFQDRQGESTRSKGRAALSGDTFQAPTTSAASTSTPPSSSSTVTGAGAEGKMAGAGTTAPTKPSIAKNTHPNSIRVHHQPYNSQNWSLMGETLVDDLLSAVRSKLQIARRMYEFTTFGFGTLGGGGGGGYSKDSSDPPDLLRRTSSRGSRSRSYRNKEHRNSGSAIELDQAIAGSMTTRAVKTTVVHRMPYSSSSAASNGLDSSEGHASPRSVRRKPSAGSGGGGGHGRGASSGSTSSVGGGGSGGSTRKRSLRSSNPVNHPALMALVNELDKDKKDKERVGQEKKATAAVAAAGESDGSCSSPIVDVLSTTSS
ncbi:hypothetical protein BGZ97_003182 [Linnemannia gamsii]|uniref:LysM domain-containing protein n=1 Tax=Linnemannia gamsii TaxID=64522 RepID=A0A9P6QUW5_9FUNG|nr:hypothetical protein BGZ97_003182 [Linnemannia gamsii]